MNVIFLVALHLQIVISYVIHQITEQDSLYNDLERKSVRELLEDINTEDQKVALAVRRTIPKIEELVLQIVPRMRKADESFIWEPEPADG